MTWLELLAILMGTGAGAGIIGAVYYCCSSTTDSKKKPINQTKTPPKSKKEESKKEDTQIIATKEKKSTPQDGLTKRTKRSEEKTKDLKSQIPTRSEEKKVTVKAEEWKVVGDGKVHNDGLVEVGALKYDTLSNPVKTRDGAGPCLWQILKNHNIPENDLQLAAQSAGVTYDKHVDTLDLQTLFKQINMLGYSVGYILDEYDMGDIETDASIRANISNYLKYSGNNVGIVLNLMIFYQQVNLENLGHYIEAENSQTRNTQISKKEEKEKTEIKVEQKNMFMFEVAFPDKSLKPYSVTLPNPEIATFLQLIEVIEKDDDMVKYEFYRLFANAQEVAKKNLRQSILIITKMKTLNKVKIMVYVKTKPLLSKIRLSEIFQDPKIKHIETKIQKYKSQQADVATLERFLKDFRIGIEGLNKNTSITTSNQLDSEIERLKTELFDNYVENVQTVRLQAASFRTKTSTKQKVPKLATELNKKGAFEKDKIYLINTPFAPVFMKTLNSGERLIFPFVCNDGNFENSIAISYDTILGKLDGEINALIKTNLEKAKQIAKEIDDYLRQPATSSFTKTEYIYKPGDENSDPRGPIKSGFFGNDRVSNIYAGCLCAILLCESSWKRNPTRGKWERGAIANAIKNLNIGIKNPFTAAFDQYVPRKVGGLKDGQDILRGVGNPKDVETTDKLTFSDSSDEN